MLGLNPFQIRAAFKHYPVASAVNSTSLNPFQIRAAFKPIKSRLLKLFCLNPFQIRAAFKR